MASDTPRSSEIKPLEGLAFFELSSRPSIRFAGQLLSWCGADVYIDADREQPKGSATTWPAESEFLDAGKSRARLEDIPALARERPVVLMAAAVGAGERHLDHGLPVLTVVPFAFEGATRGWDADSLVLSHACGFAYVTPGGATIDDPPLRFPRKMAERCAGVIIALAALALQRSSASGGARTAQVSEVESLFQFMGPPIMSYLSRGVTSSRLMSSMNDLMAPCADGHVTFSVVQASEWQRFLKLIGLPDLPDSFLNHEKRLENWDAILELARDWFGSRTSRQVFEECQRAGVPCGMIARPSELLRDEQLRGRAFLRGFTPSSGGQSCPLPSLPWKMTALPGPSSEPPRPLGQHRVEPIISPSVRKGAPPSGLPLTGLRVLELGGFWAAPRAAALLAELGAEVLKIETLKRPDLRAISVKDGETVVEPTPLFQIFNTNKRGCTIDLANPGGRQLFLDLVRDSDIVIENFRPGTMIKYGLSPGQLREVNPRIVVLSLSGFGQQGPYRDHAAYGPIVDSMSGLRSIRCYAGDPRPRMPGVSYADALSGAYGALAALTMLHYAERHDCGMYADASEVEGVLAVAPEVLLEYCQSGTDPLPAGNSEGLPPPYGAYRCAGEDRWIAIGFQPWHSWTAFSAAVGLAEEDASRYGDPDARIHDAEHLGGLVATAVQRWDAHELASLLQKVGIPASPTNSAADLLESKDMFDTGAFVAIEGRLPGPKRTYGAAIRWEGRRPDSFDEAPAFGGDNQYVFGRILGLSAERQQALKASAAIR